MSLFFKCLVLPSAMCTLLTLFLTAVCSGPWYFHFTRLWKEARTGACLEGMHRATAASACLQESGRWCRWVRQVGALQCGVMGTSEHVLCPKGQLLLSCCTQTSACWYLSFQYLRNQESQLSLKCLNSQKHCSGTMKHAVGQAWPLCRQSSNPGWRPQRLGQTA